MTRRPTANLMRTFIPAKRTTTWTGMDATRTVACTGDCCNWGRANQAAKRQRKKLTQEYLGYLTQTRRMEHIQTATKLPDCASGKVWQNNWVTRLGMRARGRTVMRIWRGSDRKCDVNTGGRCVGKHIGCATHGQGKVILWLEKM